MSTRTRRTRLVLAFELRPGDVVETPDLGRVAGVTTSFFDDHVLVHFDNLGCRRLSDTEAVLVYCDES